jgi:glycosyltransferase involved in cell wall biosynthesis
MVQRTICSVIEQTYEDWELIIIDDGSTDDTEQATKKFLVNSRITYIKKENTGQPDSLNFGAALAKGEFLTFLDSDDEAYPDWLETVNKNLNDKTGILCCGAIRRLQDGTMITEEPKKMNFFEKKLKLKFTCGSLFIRKAIFFEVGGYDPGMKCNIQTDLGYRLISQLSDSDYDIVSIDHCLVQLNIHDGERIRTNWRKVHDGGIQLLDKHYNAIKYSNFGELSNMYMVIAYSSYKLKNRLDAFRYTLKALKHNPFQLTNYLKLLKYTVLPAK